MDAHRPRLFASLLLFTLAGCAERVAPTPPKIVRTSGETMGTTYSVALVCESFPDEQLQQIEGRLAEINARMSTYDPQSELSRFNRSESADWFSVSQETAAVVDAALSLARDTNGAYDPTVAPLVELWGFGVADRPQTPPEEEQIAALLAHVGYGYVEVRFNPPALRKTQAEVSLDLSSIAKGHGVDAIAELVLGAGYDSFMVEIGGEVRAQGAKPDGTPWRIGVETPDQGMPLPGANRQLQKVVPLKDASLATSGDYRNYFEFQGRRFSHTIQPQSGRPVKHELATVTVLAETCREADGVATALLVLGPVAGYDWAAERNIAALLVSRTQTGDYLERTTPAWDAAVNPGAEP